MPIPVRLLTCDNEHCTSQFCQRRSSSDSSKNVQRDNLSMECQKSEQSTSSNRDLEQTESELRLSNPSSKFKHALTSFANESVGPLSWPKRLFSSIGSGKLEVVGAQVLSKKETPALVAIHNVADPASAVDLYSVFDLRKVYNLEGFQSPLVRVENKSTIGHGISYSEQTLQNIDRLVDWNVKKPKLAPVVESNEDIETMCLPNSLKLPYEVPTEPVVVTVMVASGIENDPIAQSTISDPPPATGPPKTRAEIWDETDLQKPVRNLEGNLSETVHRAASNTTFPGNKLEVNSEDKSQKLHVASALDPSGSQSLTDLMSSASTQNNADHGGEANTTAHVDDYNTGLVAAEKGYKDAVREAGLQPPGTTMAGSSSNYLQPVTLDLCNVSTASDPQRPRAPPATRPEKSSFRPKKLSLCKRFLNRMKKTSENRVGRSENMENTEPCSGAQDRLPRMATIKRGLKNVVRKLRGKSSVEKETAVVTGGQDTAQTCSEEVELRELGSNISPQPSSNSRTQLKGKEKQSSESEEVPKLPRKGSVADVNVPAELNRMPLPPLKGNMTDIEIPPGTNPFPERKLKSALKPPKS